MIQINEKYRTIYNLFHYNLGLRDIPDFLKENADLILKAIENMCVEDPIIIIDWRNPFPRNGRGQSKLRYFYIVCLLI